MADYGIEQIYKGVIAELIRSPEIKEAFLDDGLDVDVLQQLKVLWEGKLHEAEVLEAERKKQKLQAMCSRQSQPKPNLNSTRVVIKRESEQRGNEIVFVQRPNAHQKAMECSTSSSSSANTGMKTKPLKVIVKREQPAAGNQLPQLDGGGRGPGMSDTSSEDELENTTSMSGSAVESAKMEAKEAILANEGENMEEEPPLNSGDDLSEEGDVETIFESDNIVLCQFEKVMRNKNKWKFILRSGIMHIHGQDHCFQKLSGEADW